MFIKMSYIITISLLLILAACSPVKFSSSSIEKNVPLDPIVAENNLRTVTYKNTVTPKNNKVDIVLVIDDSKSMLADNQKLASNLSPFVNSLQNSDLDWQACVTITNAISTGNNSLVWGASLNWQLSTTYSTSLGIILKKGQANLPTIFANTINYIGAGWAGTDDERAIKAAYHHVYNGDYHYANASGCYRADAAIAYIIISDEDERSIGADKSQQYYKNEFQLLEAEDLPANFIANIRSTFGNDKRFTVNSIIVKPSDETCLKSQDSGAKSHYGKLYAELSDLTGGGIGSICDSDYSKNMNLFLDKIINSLSSVPLECAPEGEVKVKVTPDIGVIGTKVDGLNLILDRSVPNGSTIEVTYQCEEIRAPSSLNGQPVQIYQEGLWSKIINFFKNLF